MENAKNSVIATLPGVNWESDETKVSQFIHLNRERPCIEGVLQNISDEKRSTEYKPQTILTILFADGKLKKLGLPQYYGFLTDFKVAFDTYGPNRVAIRLKCVEFVKEDGWDSEKRIIEPRMVVLDA